MPKQPKASIIIRTKNESKHIGSVLSSILTQSEQDFEILIIDSGSSDATIAIAESFPKTKIIKIPQESFTFGYAINLGAAIAKGQFGVLLSGHSIPSNKVWLKNLLTPMVEDNRISGTFSRQIPHLDTNLIEKFNCERTYGDKTSTVIYSNAASAFRISSWKSHRFNEELGANEDRVWALTQLSWGRSIKYCPDSIVHHSHDEGWKQVCNRTYREWVNARSDERSTFWKTKLLAKELTYLIRITLVMLHPASHRRIGSGIRNDAHYYLNHIIGRVGALISLLLNRK